MQAPSFWYPPVENWQDGRGPRVSLAARALAPAGWLYHMAGVTRRLVTRPFRPGIPVVCIGNLTVGGTGKTPVALTIARHLQTAGLKPAFLSRGYGGRLSGPIFVDPARHRAGDVGDEPLLLAATAPTAVASNRARGARLARDQGADLLIMDDGFQNPSLRKSLSLLVMDGETLLGNGQIVPAGPLRESARSGLRRADGVILMGAPDRGTLGHRAIEAQLGRILAGFTGPVFRARLAPDPERLQHLAGGRYVAFAGIGRPTKFFATARDLGLDIAAQRPFPDHHVYTEDDLASLDKDARRHGALLLTTEKDLMRLPPERRARVAALPVHVAFDQSAAFWQFFLNALEQTREQK